MWLCIYIENDELGNVIILPTAKIIVNIGHWIWRWKYQHFWHDVAVHLYRKWWIGQYYYITHCKNHSKYRALNLEMKIPRFLTWCGSAFIENGESGNVIRSPTTKIIVNIGHWIWRWKYQHFWHGKWHVASIQCCHHSHKCCWGIRSSKLWLV